MRPLGILCALLGVSGLPALSQDQKASDTTMIELTPWRTTDDIIDGWDWSLLPGVAPASYSGIKYYDREGRQLPGNKIVSVRSSWRDLEPEEGAFDFESLRQKLKDLPDDCVGAELHVYASVWETRYLGTDRVTGATAPQWLVDKYGIPMVEEKPKTNIGTPFQVVNLDIWHPEYHRRYLRFVEAFGKSGIAQMDQVMLSYVHGKSPSRGEEAGGRYEGRALECMMERLEAWARAFNGVERKLAWVGNSGSVLERAYELGMGQRNGFVEMYLAHCNNPLLGQTMDESGYLVVDETCPPIAENRAFGDENEEYAPRAHVARFGPMEGWPHRYRESMLRVLQMRRSFVWSEGNPWVDLPLLAYVSLELGRNVETAPDVWCYLRESYLRGQAGVRGPVKNFERWLYQRDRDGCRTVPAVRVPHHESHYPSPPDQKYDFTARRTDLASGSDRIGFALDDRFLSGGPHRVAVKVTYHDLSKGTWTLAYKTPNGEATRATQCEGDGKLKTATFFLTDASFPASDLDYDFEIRATDTDATISFVRLIKL